MKLKYYFILILFALLSCKEEKEATIKEKTTSICKVNFDTNLVFDKLNFYAKVQYVCDSVDDDTFAEKYECQTKIGKYFSDENFSFYIYDDNTRLIYDKIERLWILIKANGFSGFDVKNKENRFVGLYFLDHNLTPIGYIHSSTISVFVDIKERKKLKEFKVDLSKIEKISLNKVSYNSVLNLYNEIKNKRYLIKKEYDGSHLNEYYKNNPVWTIFH